MVLIAYMQCPIFKFECLFPPELPFSRAFLSFEKMRIHCAIVLPSLVLHSETRRQLITIWPLSTFTKFSMLDVGGMRRGLMGTMACVKREHGSEIGSKVSFPSPEALFPSPFRISYSERRQAERESEHCLCFSLANKHGTDRNSHLELESFAKLTRNVHYKLERYKCFCYIPTINRIKDIQGSHNKQDAGDEIRLSSKYAPTGNINVNSK